MKTKSKKCELCSSGFLSKESASKYCSNECARKALNASNKKWRDAHPEYNNLRRKRREQARDEVIQHYGSKCQCCGEAHKEFLAIDHVYGGGSAYRKKYRNPYVWYRLIIKLGFPSWLRLLCHNCNQAMGYCGYCPHELEKKDEKAITQPRPEDGNSANSL